MKTSYASKQKLKTVSTTRQKEIKNEKTKMGKKLNWKMETETGGMWQLTSIRSQIVGYANRSCYCSIAVYMGPTIPKPPPPLPLRFSPIYFCSDILNQTKPSLFLSVSRERELHSVRLQ